jgi:septum formation protein
MPQTLVLASGSRYRRDLLTRLGIPFEVRVPEVDETPRTDETPQALATRLAQAKAAAIATQHADAWVIGADQVAVCRGRIVGKPGSAARAVDQLTAASSQTVSFYTAACLTRSGARGWDEHLDETRVLFRALSAAEIAHYVERDRPLDCAGSFRSEGLGITLLERIDSTDPTALIGLPLIWLSGALRRAGFTL